MIISQPYKQLSSCKTTTNWIQDNNKFTIIQKINSCKRTNNVRATIIAMERININIKAKEKINQWTGSKITIISKSNKLITSCRTATNVHAKIFQIERISTKI